MTAVATPISSSRRPRVGVAVLVTDARGRLLLGRRGKEPNYGTWVIPGGGVESGETWMQTAHRELLEETGLSVQIEPSQRPFVLELLSPGDHRLILCLLGTARDDARLRASSDLLEARFFCRDALPNGVSPAILPALRAFGWVP